MAQASPKATQHVEPPVIVVGGGMVGIATAMAPIIGNSLDDYLSLTEGTIAQRHIKPCDFVILFKDRKDFDGSKLGFDIRRDLGFEWSEHEGKTRDSYDPLFPKGYGFLVALIKHGRITDPGAYLADLHSHFVSADGIALHAGVPNITHENGKVTGVVTRDGPLRPLPSQSPLAHGRRLSPRRLA